MNAKEVAEKLAEPFDPSEVKFKPQMVKENRCLAMAYIDARLVQDRLDEVMGVGCWADDYEIRESGSVVCRLSLYLSGTWVTKTDVGSLSEQPDDGDRLKAAFSDALKRAAVKFGIGRYLYRLQAQWVDYDPVKKRINTTPQLPKWALPTVGSNGKSKDEPAKTETETTTDQKVTFKTLTPAEKKARDDLYKITKIEWEKMLSAIETPDELGQLMFKFKPYDEGLKSAIWPTIKEFYTNKGWQLDNRTNKFFIPDKVPIKGNGR